MVGGMMDNNKDNEECMTWRCDSLDCHCMASQMEHDPNLAWQSQQHNDSQRCSRTRFTCLASPESFWPRKDFPKPKMICRRCTAIPAYQAAVGAPTGCQGGETTSGQQFIGDSKDVDLDHTADSIDQNDINCYNFVENEFADPQDVQDGGLLVHCDSLGGISPSNTTNVSKEEMEGLQVQERRYRSMSSTTTISSRSISTTASTILNGNTSTAKDVEGKGWVNPEGVLTAAAAVTTTTSRFHHGMTINRDVNCDVNCDVKSPMFASQLAALLASVEELKNDSKAADTATMTTATTTATDTATMTTATTTATTTTATDTADVLAMENYVACSPTLQALPFKIEEANTEEGNTESQIALPATVMPPLVDDGPSSNVNVILAVARKYIAHASLGPSVPSELEEPSCYHSVSAPLIYLDTYLTRMRSLCKMTDEAFVLGLIYTGRLLNNRPEIPLNFLTVHRIALACTVIAAKFFDDVFYSNSCYARAGGVTLKEMNALEFTTLGYLNFRLYVDPKVYHRYYARCWPPTALT